MLSHKEAKQKARWLRRQAVDLVVRSKKGHLGGSFSCVEILIALYYRDILNVDPKNPLWSDRDRFILSKGHACIVLYPILADLGFISEHDLYSFCVDGSFIGNHPDRNIPGVDVSTGSLGNGLGIGAGMALAAKKDGKKHKIYVLLGDGECYEGSVWEAIQFIGHHNLNNIIAIVDRNRQCVTDFTKNCSCLEPFEYKWDSFGWNVSAIDGHCFEDLSNIQTNSDRPLVVISETVKGEGISFMQRVVSWHHGIPTKDELVIIEREL